MLLEHRLLALVVCCSVLQCVVQMRLLVRNAVHASMRRVRVHTALHVRACMHVVAHQALHVCTFVLESMSVSAYREAR